MLTQGEFHSEQYGTHKRWVLKTLLGSVVAPWGAYEDSARQFFQDMGESLAAFDAEGLPVFSSMQEARCRALGQAILEALEEES